MYRLNAFLFAALLIAGTGTGSVHGQSVTFNDFDDLSDFTLNGSTGSINTGGQGVLNGNGDRVLRLTDDRGQSGGAFLTDPLTLASDASFSSFFRFQLTDPTGISDSDGQGADGIVFVVQTDAADTGGIGAGIGFAGINPSVGVEFDTFNNGSSDANNGNHIGIDLNGTDNSTFQTNITPRFNNGSIWHAWVDFDGTTDTLEARVSTSNVRPAAPTVSRNVDLLSVLGQTEAFVGFVSGTGAASNDHDILNLQFTGEFAPLNTELVTAPNDGGTLELLARVGTSTSAGVNVANGGPTGTADLTGSAGSPSDPAFGGPTEPAAFTLAPGADADFTYTFTPGARTGGTPITGAVTISSNEDGDHLINLSGQGVGPVFDAFSSVAFGDVDADATTGALINLSNVTPDGDLGDLTDLTLNAITIGGDDAGLFALNNFTPGQTIAAGDLFTLIVDYIGDSTFGDKEAFLTLETDQGAALAGDGDDFQINLTATAIPEPGTAATALIVTALFATRRRQRDRKQGHH